MCLYAKLGHDIEIADRPIIVKKIISRDCKFLWFKFLESFVRKTIHRYNRVLKAVKHLKIEENRSIHMGFHAYVGDIGSIPDDIFRYAIIPKGSEYCLGINNEIVANKMIIFDNVEKFKAYVSNC